MTDEAEAARTYLRLTQLLDDVERDHPEISATLRLTLVRSRRRHQAGWLDAERFREVLAQLIDATQAAQPSRV